MSRVALPSVLIVDDNRETCLVVSRLVAAPDRQVEVATTAEQALARAEARPFDVVITDLDLQADQSGLDVLRTVKQVNPAARVIIISAYGSLATAVEALRGGAFDYIGKPFDHDALRATVDRALAQQPMVDGVEPAIAPNRHLVGRAPVMLQLYKQIAQAAPATAPALLLGESGSGKDLVARALHEHGPRAGRPFLTLNCAAIPDALLESALFGHVAGAFPGATADRAGVLEQAQGGTVFLDEIGEISAAMQARLLGAVQDREVRRVGSQDAVRVDARVVTATNVDLEGAVAAGRFRQDLFFRLAVFLIRVPPLRDRRQDIPLLVEHFAKSAGARLGQYVTFSAPALARLRQYDWPGNVRELENVVERLVVSARAPVVEAADIALDVTPTTSAGVHPFTDLPTLDELERRYLVFALQRFRGNRTRTAAALGIDRRTLYRMSARLGVPITGTDLHVEPD
jgi:DNA-binding NtrC family response regulator